MSLTAPNITTTLVTSRVNILRLSRAALEKEITYQIIDSFGRVLEQGSFLQSKELNISPYPPGIYYCQIKKGQNIIDSKRFVIIR